MSNTASKVFVLGPSGGGKSSSLRGLDPKVTCYINTDRKEPPLEGWVDNYKTVFTPEGLPDWTKSNYIEPSLPSTVIKAFIEWERREDIQNIILDTATHMIMADYIENAIGKDYKEYQKMGKNFYSLMDLMLDSKKNCIIYAHSELSFNEMGDKILKMATPGGKMIDGFVPPSFFTTVLHTHMEVKDKKQTYSFRTRPDFNGDPVKNPARFVGEEATNALNYLEPNNIQIILDKLEAFRKGIKPVEQPKVEVKK